MITAPGYNETLVMSSNTKHISFSPAQMLAHHTVGGCPMRAGDLFASGTLSGATLKEAGCLLEATWNGTQKLKLVRNHGDGASGNEVRTWLKDGDTVSFRVGGAASDIDFGACEGTICSTSSSDA
jgi:fumarylacetoacetase